MTIFLRKWQFLFQKFNLIFKDLAFETLAPWCKEVIDFINVIGERLIAEPGDSKSKKFLFPCYSTWKRCKHSRHFSRFRIIIGNVCIVNQRCYVLKLINYIYLFYITLQFPLVSAAE
jgi:hypothetical protein